VLVSYGDRVSLVLVSGVCLSELFRMWAIPSSSGCREMENSINGLAVAKLSSTERDGELQMSDSCEQECMQLGSCRQEESANCVRNCGEISLRSTTDPTCSRELGPAGAVTKAGQRAG